MHREHGICRARSSRISMCASLWKVHTICVLQNDGKYRKRAIQSDSSISTETIISACWVPMESASDIQVPPRKHTNYVLSFRPPSYPVKCKESQHTTGKGHRIVKHSKLRTRALQPSAPLPLWAQAKLTQSNANMRLLYCYKEHGIYLPPMMLVRSIAR